MPMRSGRDIQYVGRPTITEEGREVLAFHFHRYLASWMNRRAHHECWISIGFEETNVEAVTFRLTASRAQAVEVAWTFDDLCSTYRHGDNRLIVEQGRNETTSLEAIPLFDESANDGLGVLIGFAIFDESAELSQTEIGEVQNHALEALRTARRNSVRLFFEDHRDLDIKPFFYALLNRLPEWCGCDSSASIILADSVETVAQAEGDSNFHIMAERLFDTEDRSTERLVGMAVRLGEDDDDILAASMRAQRSDPGAPAHVYRRDRQAGIDRWLGADSSRPLTRFHALGGRKSEEAFLHVPLIGGDEDHVELLGFISMVFAQEVPIGKTALEVFEVIATHLSTRLAHSQLYSLSAKKVVLLRRVAAACEEAVAADGDPLARLEKLQGRVTELIAFHSDVPSASVGYVTEDDGERILRYRHPYGWTDLEQIDLAINVVPGSHHDTGVTALAVRIGRPVVLAGGRPDESTFKNHLWVDENRGELVDARRPSQAEQIAENDGWYPLREVYKPARHGAYATLAFPVKFAGEALGVLAIEVDRDTNWAWWTGYGGRLVWELLTDHLGAAFRALMRS